MNSIASARAAEAFDDAFVRRAPKLGIRAEAEADAPFLRGLFARCSPMRDTLPAELLAHQWWMQSASHRSAHPAAMRRIVAAGGAPVGRIIVDWTPADHSRLIDIAVAPDHRATGAGLHLPRAWLEVSDALRKTCRLTVLAANPARGLYARLGFVAVEDLSDGQPLLEMARRVGPISTKRDSLGLVI
jgi:ribosomal protein S18 acetylase RimI-like enzyme